MLGIPETEQERVEREDGERAVERRRVAMRDCLATPQGRHLFYEILADLGAFQPVYGERMEGRHEAAHHIVGMIKDAGLPYYLKMIEENET